MKTISLRVVTRPGNEIDICARDEDQFTELRGMYPYHATEEFDRLPNGEIKALLRPLRNVVPLNGKYLNAA